VARKKTLKVGVVGTGIGRLHIRGYQKVEGVEVVALVDLDRKRGKRVAQEYSIPRALTDYRDLMSMDEIEAVSVCTPNAIHREVAVAALGAGKHVLCEKPLADNAEEGAKIVEAARTSGRKLMMAFNNRFRGDTGVLKRYIEAGELGEIYYAKTGWVRRRGIPGLGTWFTTKALSGGGPLIDLGVHVLDLTLWLMGNPRAQSVVGATYAKFGPRQKSPRGRKKRFDVEDLATAFIRLETGATVLLEASWASNIGTERTYSELMGTKGGAECPPLRVYQEKHGTVVDLEPRFPQISGHEAEIAHFVECVRSDQTPMATGEEGLEIMRILDAIYLSAKTGKEVSLSTTA
jgi:predicted dehydrogenase